MDILLVGIPDLLLSSLGRYIKDHVCTCENCKEQCTIISYNSLGERLEEDQQSP